MAATVDPHVDPLAPHVSILDKNLPSLLSKINITSGLWDHMIAEGVIGFEDVENIKVGFTYSHKM